MTQPSAPSRFKQAWNVLRGREVKHASYAYAQTYLQEIGKAVWSPREYGKFAEEGYVKNVVAHRCIRLIAESASAVKWQLYADHEGGREQLKQHPALQMLHRPNPTMGGSELIEALVTYKLISGNAYLLSVGPKDGNPQELYCLRPDRMKVIAGRDFVPQGYEYQVGERITRYSVDRLTGRSSILHLKSFHPMNDWYGLSPIEAAAYSIDQHNQAAVWNQALLQNGAKPSGALVVQTRQDGSGGHLSDEQFTRIKSQIDEQYAGALNAGRPLLLEGGLDWREMSLSPKDMDFIDGKHSSARDIALAFGVPPQLLGIPGDNTYSNLVEARLGLWEQTILPLLDKVTTNLNSWLLPAYSGGETLQLQYDTDAISALAPRRDYVWKRVKDADFLTVDEKRAALGYGPLGEN